MGDRTEEDVPCSQTATEKDTLSVGEEGKATSSPSPVGSVVAGKYLVQRIVGEGGMGVVVAALHLGLNEPVALKFLTGAMKGAAAERFQREARIAFRLKSEHVARLLDVGTVEDGSPFLVMELLDGETLSGRLAARGPLTVAEASDVVLQTCEGLAEAHRLGIVHRDLKPSNVMMTRRPDGSMLVKILDFGIAKLLAGKSPLALAQGSSAAPAETAASTVLGSPAYMSPEQFQSSKDVDERADIWSLGVMLHELVSGKLPFAAKNAIVLARAIMEEQPKLHLAGAPEPFVRVVARCLEKDRGARYRNVGELANAIASFASPSSRPSAERAARIVSQPIPTPSTPRSEPTHTTEAYAKTQGPRGTLQMEREADPPAVSAWSPTPAAIGVTKTEEDAVTLRAGEQVGRARSPSRSRTKVWLVLGGLGLVATVAIIAVTTSGTSKSKTTARSRTTAEETAAAVKPTAAPSGSAAVASAPSASGSPGGFSFSISFGSASASAAPKSMVGQKVKANREGSWEDAQITDQRGDRYRVHWAGDDPARDEWVEASRIRPL